MLHDKLGHTYVDIPCYDNGVWTTVSYNSREEFAEDLIKNYFKEPGEYALDETVLEWQREGNHFREHGYYCDQPEGSRDFITYWDQQKIRSRKGAFFWNNGKKWYLPRDYYFWINFLQIPDKVKKEDDFTDIWDSQMHMALYEFIGELSYKHGVVLKKRQFGSSLYHAAKLINILWFEQSPILKIGASLSAYITGVTGTWKILQAYRIFLNKHTAWYRPMNPGGVGEWQQKIEYVENGRKTEKGRKGVLQSLSFEQSDTAGVGGLCTLFFYEEAGIAKSMDKTYEFMRPAMESGDITTGYFIAAGSVGDLKQCEPLKVFMYKPEGNGFFGVRNKWCDSKGTIQTTGLFIPEQWSMPPYIDEFGNSQIEEALAAIELKRKQWKKDLAPEQYQIRISQHPTNLEEAFAFRGESLFPIELVKSMKRDIEEGDYPYRCINLAYDNKGEIIASPTTKRPILIFPVDKTAEDKTGAIQVWEEPDEEKDFCTTYFASVDPVSEGKAEHIDNMLYTPTGRKRIGDIQVGDKVIGSNGKAINVIGVYPQGAKKLCKLTFSDGHSIKVCQEHLWTIKLNGGTKGYITLSVKDLLDTAKIITYTGTGRNIKKKYTISTYYKDKQNRNKWSIPIVKPIEFDTAENLIVNPYLLGLLLGDGGISQRSINFSTVDTELVKSIESILDNDLLIKKVKNSNCDYTIITKVGSRNSLTQKLKILGLKGKRSENKFIPEEYMYSMESNRLSLLQGLMDTDGSYSNHGAEFYSSSKILAHQVVELVQSLGGIAKIRCKKTTHLDSYIVRVLLPEQFNPFILKRKREIYKPSKVFSRYITNIEYVDNAEAVCISVDAPDNLYVTEHGLVTHNTVTSDSLCSIHIYKNPLQVQRVKVNGEVETFIEGDKIVAAWCGRFDDINKTHERLELMIEWYQAWTIVENNVPLFIQYMQFKRKQKYLVPSSQMLFSKEIQQSKTQFQQYGWRNVSTIFKTIMLSYLIEYLREELDEETDDNGKVYKKYYGISRIPDYMALVEMEHYQPGVNVDRLISLGALIAFVRIQEASRGLKKRTEYDNEEHLEKSENLYKLNRSPFRHIGSGSQSLSMQKPRNPFKNFR